MNLYVLTDSAMCEHVGIFLYEISLGTAGTNVVGCNFVAFMNAHVWEGREEGSGRRRGKERRAKQVQKSRKGEK